FPAHTPAQTGAPLRQFPALPSYLCLWPRLARRLSEYGRTLRGSTRPARRETVLHRPLLCALLHDALAIPRHKQSELDPRRVPPVSSWPPFVPFHQNIAAAPNGR